MDNPEEVMQILERFNMSRNPEISSQLEEYITFVARTGDSVYAWSLVKNLFREKLVTVITDFHNESPTKELPQYPNVDPFNYETMKKMLIEKLESFAAAPFTIQRISELLSDPRKQYSRIDKFMRAVEKTILVVSTVPPGRHRSESENGDSLDSALNGDFPTEVNVDIEMEQDPSLAVTKDESSVASPCKESNPKIPLKKSGTETIKSSESPSKDEAGTSESAGEKLETGESVKKTVAEASKDAPALPETKVIESLEKTASEATAIETATEVKTQNDENVAKSVAALTQSEIDVPVVEAIEAEPKLDDSLLNEPIRSADNEILVDTAEIISETTPLAALENIVAIRTDAAAAADLEATELQTVIAIVVTPEPETNENRDEVIVQTPTSIIDESESEAKRLKIEETTEIVPESSSAQSEKTVEADKITQEDSLIPELEEEESQEATVVSLQSESVNAELSEPLVVEEIISIPIAETPEAAVVTIEEPILEDKIDEPLPEIADIPIEIVPSNDENIVEAASAEMETIPIAENKMSLDEDEPPALELEMTPIASKMDTDEAEANAPMDFEDDAEPMDQ